MWILSVHVSILQFPVLTSLICSVHSASIGIFNSIGVESFHAAGVIGVRREVVEDEAVYTAIWGLKGGG